MFKSKYNNINYYVNLAGLTLLVCKHIKPRHRIDYNTYCKHGFRLS